MDVVDSDSESDGERHEKKSKVTDLSFFVALNSQLRHTKHLHPGQSFLKRFVALRAGVAKEAQNKQEHDRLKARITLLPQTVSHSHSTGHERFCLFMRALDAYGVERSPEQILFHKWYTQACLPFIYGEQEWPSVQARVLSEVGLNKLSPCVLCMAPRRFGKTWAIAMLVAALLFAVPGITIAVFSTGKRASGSLMREVKRFLSCLPGACDRYLLENQEQLHLAPYAIPRRRAPGDPKASALFPENVISKLSSFPSNVDGRKRLYVAPCPACKPPQRDKRLQRSVTTR